MTKTTNYQLPKWEKTDRVQMKDFNDMTATLDTALKANADTAAAASAAVALCGNCKIETSTYTGNGKYGSANPTTLTFPKRPTAVILFGYQTLLLITDKFSAGKSAVLGYYGNYASWDDNCYPTWTGSTLKIVSGSQARNQANEQGVVYQVIAFYAQDK